MGLLDDIRNRLSKIRVAATGSVRAPAPQIPAVPGLGQIDVVDTTQNPTVENIPGSWARAWLGPGQPMAPMQDTARAKDAETEPRSFQYITSVNSTFSPRAAYGLTPFSQLRTYGETVPEVSMCMRILTEELKAFVPQITDEKGTKVEDAKLKWMIESPDGFNPWPVWLSRFLYNVLVYDAGCAYYIRDSRNKIRGSRVIDGSTVFVLIDERGEQPMPPAPAFQQIIWGTPHVFLNTNQLWYKPRHLRADAPYGRSPIEDALPAVILLNQLWDYEAQKYVVGNIPELIITAPEQWKDDADQILVFEEAFNARMSGSNLERVRVRFLPHGMESIATKEMSFNKETYDSATNSVRMAFGILQSEVGDAPTGGLGGSGYAEAMQSAFFRMGLAPLISYVESHFNDIIKINRIENRRFNLAFPPESLDPQKEEEKQATRFQIGGITRNEYRQGIGLPALQGELGDFIVTPGGGQQEGEDGNDPMAALMGGLGGKKPGLSGGIQKPVRVVSNPTRINAMHSPVGVLKSPVSVYKVDDEIIRLASLIGYTGDMDEFAKGVQEEREHIKTVHGDMETVARIAADHLSEDPAYYRKLNQVMNKYDKAKLQKISGVDVEDDAYYGSNIQIRTDVDMPNSGTNESLIVSIANTNQEPMPAIWKPGDGESHEQKEMVGGNLFCRAEAVYWVDRTLSPDDNSYLVPVTYTAEIDGVLGSIKYYVSGKQPRAEINSYDQKWVEQAAVLDYITGQLDRDGKNWLTHPTDSRRPILIDADMSFPVEENKPIKSTFVEAMAGKPLSERILDSLYLMIGNRELWDDLNDIMDNQDAVEHAKSRAIRLYNEKQIPINKEPIEVIEHPAMAGNKISVVWDVQEKPEETSEERMIAVKNDDEAEMEKANILEEMFQRVGRNYLEKAEDAEILAEETYAWFNPDDELDLDTTIPQLYYYLAKQFVLKTDWEEDKHPRGKGGKFAPKGSAGGGSGDEGNESIQKPAERLGAPMPAKDKPRLIRHSSLDDKTEVVDFRLRNYGAAVKELSEYLKNIGFSEVANELSEEFKSNIASGINPADAYDKYLKQFPDKKDLVGDELANITRMKNKYRLADLRFISKLKLEPKPVSVGGGGGKPAPAPKPAPKPAVSSITEKKNALKDEAVNKYYENIQDDMRDWLEFKNSHRGGKLFTPAELSDKYDECRVKGEAGFKEFMKWAKTKADAYEAVHGLRKPGGETMSSRLNDLVVNLKDKHNPELQARMTEIEHMKDAAFLPKRPAKDIPREEMESMLRIGGAELINHKSLSHHVPGADVPAGGVNEAYVVEVTGDGRAILKPENKSKVYGGPENEMFAYDLSKALGMDVVPVTQYNEHNKRPASVQSFMEDCKVGMDLKLGDVKPTKELKESFSQMAILDAITFNNDRHEGNFLYDTKLNKIYAIDNGFSGLRPWGFHDESSPPERAAKNGFRFLRSNWDTLNYDSGGKLGRKIYINPEHLKKAEEFVSSPDYEKYVKNYFGDAHAAKVIRASRAALQEFHTSDYQTMIEGS